jgi:hypothetical protein
MDDFIIDELLDEPLPPRTGATGPRTPEGKAKSSQNSLQHGCRSEKSVLPDEDPAAFEATVQHWFSYYQPDNAAAVTLVENLALAAWQLKRNQKRLDEVEYRLPGDAHCWTDDQQKRYATFSRYYTTAERRFLRNFKEVEAFYHRTHRDDQARQLAFAKLAAVEFKRLDKADEAALKQVRLEQVVEVEIVDGTCRSYFYPSDREVMEIAAKRPAPPLYIARQIVFPCGLIPAEYAWADPLHSKAVEMPEIRQRILWKQWLDVIKQETAIPGGHVGPTVRNGIGRGLFPYPCPEPK